jgi:4a-hydroxytetrahydrobiopterin dehydratase
MNKFASLHCSVITAATPELNEDEIGLYQVQLPNWEIYQKNGEPRLEKVFLFKDFKQALDFTNRVGQVAEAENHHPAILTEWGKVTITWWTHKIRGLHLNDFIMAAKTDQLAA